MHALFDRYADWLYDKHFQSTGISFLLFWVDIFALVMALDDGRWLLVVAVFLPATVAHGCAGFHGINRAYPMLSDAPACTRGRL